MSESFLVAAATLLVATVAPVACPAKARTDRYAPSDSTQVRTR
jgi:hypothetical protein